MERGRFVAVRRENSHAKRRRERGKLLSTEAIGQESQISRVLSGTGARRAAKGFGVALEAGKREKP